MEEEKTTSLCNTPPLRLEDFPTCFPFEEQSKASIAFDYDENVEVFAVTIENHRQKATFNISKEKAVFVAEKILSIAKK